jgi:uncharacterized protein
MDPTQTHGAFSWNELTTPDLDRAAAFYGPLFGWKIADAGGEYDGYRMASLGEVPVCGLMAPSPGAPNVPPNWGSYVTVSDVQAILDKALAMGATHIMGPIDVPKVGRMAIFADPQGAVLSIMQYERPA